MSQSHKQTHFAKVVLGIFLILFVKLTAFSQNNTLRPNANYEEDHLCGTLDPTPEQIEQTIKDMANFIPVKNAGTNCVGIMPHIFRTDGGTGGLTTEQLAKGLTFLNKFYLDTNIEFYYCGVNYINNSDLYDFDGTAPDNDTEDALAAATTIATDAVNIFFLNSIVTASGLAVCGYAYFPNDSPATNRILMDISCMFNANGTYVHEFGHYFNVYHTHQSTEHGPGHANAENVPRNGIDANCSTKGDLLCDTEADPRYDSSHFDVPTCMDTGGEMDINGVLYTPPVENLMSYYPDVCGGIFTTEQYTRIQAAYVTRSNHTTYSFDCTPPTVSVPTGLTATFTPNRIALNWVDAANNELGYLLERSTTSSSAGFEAIVNGATGENGTSLSDSDIIPNMTYWYRVKPINGDCDTYSTTATETTPSQFFCPANSNICDEFIGRVQIGTIDNTTACTPSGYHNYQAQSTDVSIGVIHPLTITNGTPAYPLDRCGVWVDWNHDDDFEDANESITVFGSPGIGPYTANISPPAGTPQGDHIIRIRITYNTPPLPCGTQNWGEVEDYTLSLNTCMGILTRTWTGAVNNDWTNTGNWDCGVPTNMHDVIIPSGTPDAILNSGQTGFCHTIDVQNGAVLIVPNDAELIVEEP